MLVKGMGNVFNKVTSVKFTTLTKYPPLNLQIECQLDQNQHS